MKRIKIAFFGDVVGKPGLRLMREHLEPCLQEGGWDFAVVNGENAASGAGLTPDTSRVLFSAGADVVTTGDHVYRRRADFEKIQDDPRILRPANLPPEAAGHGATVVESHDGVRVGVINILGRVFMNPADCPFRTVDRLLEEMEGEADVIVVDFHAEASSEKVAMGWHLDGRVAAVVGTHTHVPTADGQILEQGTAYVTDLGMVGAYHGVIGRVKERVLFRFRTGMPTPFNLAEKDVRGPGFGVTIDLDSGLATSVRPLLLGEPPRTRFRPGGASGAGRSG